LEVVEIDGIRYPVAPGLDPEALVYDALRNRPGEALHPERCDAMLIFGGGDVIRILREAPGRYTYASQSIGDVAAAFAEEPLDTGWLPVGTIRAGWTNAGPFFAVYHAPQRWAVQVYTGQRQDSWVVPREQVIDGIQSLTVPLPGLVFFGLGQRYHLWALQGDPKPDAGLFWPPVPNLYSSTVSAICWGQNRPPTATAQGMRDAWALFLAAYFSFAEVAGRSRAHPKDVRTQLTTLDRSGAEAYPLDDLIPMTASIQGKRQQWTLADALDACLRNWA
jgi:hypothetical protein